MIRRYIEKRVDQESIYTPIKVTRQWPVRTINISCILFNLYFHNWVNFASIAFIATIWVISELHHRNHAQRMANHAEDMRIRKIDMLEHYHFLQDHYGMEEADRRMRMVINHKPTLRDLGIPEEA